MVQQNQIQYLERKKEKDNNNNYNETPKNRTNTWKENKIYIIRRIVTQYTSKK